MFSYGGKLSRWCAVGRERELRSWLDGIPRGSARALIARELEDARRLLQSVVLTLLDPDDALEPPLPAKAILVVELEDADRSVQRARRLARQLSARVVMLVEAGTLPASSFYGALWLEDPLRAGRPHPESPAEQLLARALFRDEELAPRFELNQPLLTPQGRSVIVDLIDRTGRLIVEIDGWTAHGTHDAFIRDRQRDYELALAGYLVLRLTHEEVIGDLHAALEKIRALVRLRG